ncbi:MAG: hypothetical protein WKF70_08190 [Chitinophagaceae bacterium]
MGLSTQQQLHFLQEKVRDIGSAIFYNQSEAVLKLPTSLVTTLKVDDFGYVWFFIKKPKQDIRQFENEFPVRMDFFKKGVDYFVQAAGKGRVVVDPEELSVFFKLHHDLDEHLATTAVLVKVKMVKAEYFETHTRVPATWWRNALVLFSTYLRHPVGTVNNTYFSAS